MSSAAAQFASNWSELLNLDAFVLGSHGVLQTALQDLANYPWKT